MNLPTLAIDQFARDPADILDRLVAEPCIAVKQGDIPVAVLVRVDRFDALLVMEQAYKAQARSS